MNDELKDKIMEIHYDEVDKWVKKHNLPAVRYSTYELLSKNACDEVMSYYYRLANISLRKQKLDKLWKKTQV